MDEPTDVKVNTREREHNYAYVRETHVPHLMNQAFIRLVQPGTTTPSNTFMAEDCMVDVDAHGNVIGIMATWTTGEEL